MVDLETATTRLYEETNLTDELVDQDATTLLKWAEQQVAELVAKYGSDETAFENAFGALRSMVKNMNRYVGQREVSDETQQTERLENITQSASEIGFEMTPTFGSQSLARTVQNNSELLQAMLSSLQKTDTPQAANTSTHDAALTPQTSTTAVEPVRHTRRMELQQKPQSPESGEPTPTTNTSASELLSSEPQEITEERIVNVFTVPEAVDTTDDSEDEDHDPNLSSTAN